MERTWVFFSYSGRGGMTKNLGGDDSLTKMVLTKSSIVDYEGPGHIVDDQMHEIVVKTLLATG